MPAGNFNIAYAFRAVDNFTSTMKRINRSVIAHEKQIKKAGMRLKAFGASATRIGKTLTTRLTLPITAAGTGMVIAASKFEKGLANVYSLLTEEQIKTFGKDLEKAQEDAVKMGFSIDDVNKSLFDLVSNLDISEKVLQTYYEAQKLSIAGDAEITAAVKGVTKVMSTYGVETLNVSRIMNAFFTAQDIGATTVQELAENVGTFSGQAREAGLSIEDTLVTFSALTKVLRNTERAATGMSAIIKALTKPEQQAAKRLKDMGIAYGFAGVRSKGFVNVLKQVITELGKNRDKVARAIPEVEAFRALTALNAETLTIVDDAIKQVNVDMKNGSGMMKAYNYNLKIFDRIWKMLKGRIKTLAKSFGVELLPKLSDLFEKIIKISDKLSKLEPETKKTILAIGGVVAIIGPLIILLGTLASALGLATIGFGAFWGSALAPITGAILLIGALAALGVYLYNKFEPFKNLVDYIYGILKGIISFATGLGGKVGSWIFGKEKETATAKPELAKKAKGDKSTFEGTLNIAGAPKGSTLQTATTGAMNMNVGLNMEGAY
jgi:TP901 family phage tail tape measure protein